MVPTKHTSKYVDHSRGANGIHEPNDENPAAVLKNLKTKEFRNSKNPYFNKKQIKTKHAKFLDSNTLWQLG